MTMQTPSAFDMGLWSRLETSKTNPDWNPNASGRVRVVEAKGVPDRARQVARINTPKVSCSNACVFSVFSCCVMYGLHQVALLSRATLLVQSGGVVTATDEIEISVCHRLHEGQEKACENRPCAC